MNGFWNSTALLAVKTTAVLQPSAAEVAVTLFCFIAFVCFVTRRLDARIKQLPNCGREPICMRTSILERA